MPRKIRELKADLRQAGFYMKPGKGSHTNWFHARYAGCVTISGADGGDAARYQEVIVAKAIDAVEKTK
jgi:predicted RNA binding protein YcfA (HicA-like mRNA interferase family)